LIRTAETPRLEVVKTDAGEKRPVLDGATFEVLSKLILSQTKHLRTELPPRMEFLGITVEAAPTASGRWYMRMEDTRGQKMDVIFGTGTFPQAVVYIHEHMGRGAVEETLSDNAARELATLMLGASLTPERKDVDEEEEDIIVDEDDDENTKAQEEERLKKIAAMRVQFLEQAKEQLKIVIERGPLKQPPLMREIERKTAEELSEADIERMISTVASTPITLKAFVLENVDNTSMRMSVPGGSEDTTDFIELVVDRDDDEKPVVWMRVCVRPPPAPERELSTELEGDQQITDEIDDDILTPFLDVTHTSLGVALIQYAAKTLDPPIELDNESELMKLLLPEPEVEEPKKKRTTGAWGRASPKMLRTAEQFQQAIDAMQEGIQALKDGATPTKPQIVNIQGRIAAVRRSPAVAGSAALKNRAMSAANQLEKKLVARTGVKPQVQRATAQKPAPAKPTTTKPGVGVTRR
jgi:hypothetical protein